ncbi:MAG: bifunctional 4-hydroxy-2-oxoglutarate aldolase/2-dehydro-3-deoxy-phosphogluconate aldolase [Treponema sp.]|jgi:2-dehydro-3-deoxyphosphogluconate aldolase/(4S)-4-hydroxy-2-oxoglutarate aldolase|nr:bifunctional 4-hydroxy-2-oxoglutarate aldolase/2-dehydro-3-deoxy-phosphogluconate aldolase [Treponema sp.]
MKLVMPAEIQKKIADGGIIAVLEIESEQNAVPTARALLEGGITVIELALRTPAALPSIALIAKEVPQMFIGAGTVIESGQAAMAKQSGGCFGVSPGVNPEIVREAIAADLPFAPGIATPSELDQAVCLGCRTVKFFPAESMGGINYLKNINGPYNHLGIKYIPLGGITPSNLIGYAQFNPVLAVGGTWIANKELIKTQDWKEITKRAREAKEIWNGIR